MNFFKKIPNWGRTIFSLGAKFLPYFITGTAGYIVFLLSRSVIYSTKEMICKTYQEYNAILTEKIRNQSEQLMLLFKEIERLKERQEVLIWRQQINREVIETLTGIYEVPILEAIEVVNPLLPTLIRPEIVVMGFTAVGLTFVGKTTSSFFTKYLPFLINSSLTFTVFWFLTKRELMNFLYEKKPFIISSLQKLILEDQKNKTNLLESIENLHDEIGAQFEKINKAKEPMPEIQEQETSVLTLNSVATENIDFESTLDISIALVTEATPFIVAISLAAIVLTVIVPNIAGAAKSLLSEIV